MLYINVVWFYSNYRENRSKSIVIGVTDFSGQSVEAVHILNVYNAQRVGSRGVTRGLGIVTLWGRGLLMYSSLPASPEFEEI